MDFKHYIAELLHSLTDLGIPEIEALIEVPPDNTLGDYAFPCFTLAKTFKKAPAIIASDVASKAQPHLADHHISTCAAHGAYVNFFVDKAAFSKHVIERIAREGVDYGRGSVKHETVMIEFSSPNTNKPQHLGHVRNNLLGEALANILSFQGYKVIKTCLVNDRGVHICKSMLAYERFGKHETPESSGKKGDHLVGDYYVIFQKEALKDPTLETQAQDLLRRWEANDPEVRALWKKMNTWVLEGFKQTYARLGVSFDKFYYESDLYMHGKEVVLDGQKKGLFKEEDGAVMVDLTPFKLPKKVLIRSDGTSIYMTQDIYLAQVKFDDYHMDRSVYVVANEQDLHFKQLFAILKILNLPYANKCYHLSYGMIALPEGRMKSREGTVVDADNLIDELERLSSDEVKNRYADLSEEETLTRANTIALCALKYFILKYDAKSDFIYDPKESIAFEGETGPYVQYAFARISSIEAKAQHRPDAQHAHLNLLTHPKEHALISVLANYPDALEHAASRYDPSLVARYLFSLAQSFNEFYHVCPILQAEEKERDARLALIQCVKTVIASGFGLLGIDTLAKM